MKRLTQIEGLRAYLAFWVVFDHIFNDSSLASSLTGPARLITQGGYAVDIFVIISGFVIFYLLDSKRESYTCFITRRFLRLWPLFIVVYLLSVFLFPLQISDDGHLRLLHPGAFLRAGEQTMQACHYFYMVLLLHVFMLHGIIPNKVIPYAPVAFLNPAWSVSLEWQFYLIAPFVFAFLKRPTSFRITLVSGAVIALFILGKLMPPVKLGAFLPMHVEYFYFGCLSYFLFRRLSTIPLGLRLFPLACAGSFFVFLLSGRDHDVLPICFWIPFFCLLIDRANPANNDFTRWVSWLFDNRWAQYLGRISYSVYLTHPIVITLCQGVIVSLFPTLTLAQQCMLLGCLVVPSTLAVSSVFHKFIEEKGIRLGSILARKIKERELIRVGSTLARRLAGT